MATIDLQKHIWEGWRVIDFINELEPLFSMFTTEEFGSRKPKTKEEIKAWCMDNQPYYKKYIPEVVNHFYHKQYA